MLVIIPLIFWGQLQRLLELYLRSLQRWKTRELMIMGRFKESGFWVLWGLTGLTVVQNEFYLWLTADCCGVVGVVGRDKPTITAKHSGILWMKTKRILPMNCVWELIILYTPRLTLSVPNKLWMFQLYRYVFLACPVHGKKHKHNLHVLSLGTHMYNPHSHKKP